MWNLLEFKDNIALASEEGQEITYSGLSDKCAEFAENTGKRNLVLIMCSNCIETVAGYISSVQNRNVPILLNDGIDDTLLNRLIAAYQPMYIWTPSGHRKRFAGTSEIYQAGAYVLLRNQAGKKWRMHDDLALLLATSGSTGSPKFVRQSYRNIEANTKSIIKYLGIGSSERAITTLPMNYTYGLSVINTHLSVGATILLTKSTLMQRGFWNFFKGRGATSFGGVPYTYEMLDKLGFFGMDLPSLRTMTQAGGKLTPELHEKFAKFAYENGKKFVVMYGQCEATARMGYLPPDMAVKKKGSMGIAIPGGRFRLVDAYGEEITVPHVTGELIYEGANVTLGYAEQGADLVKGDERHGVLATGDMAQFDEDGYFYIVGRKKRFLKIYGNRVNLDEVERLVKGEFEIEAACAGVDDHMYIFLTNGAKAAEVKNYVASMTKLNQSAFKTVVVDGIPKNDSGKTLYQELEKYYEE